MHRGIGGGGAGRASGGAGTSGGRTPTELGASGAGGSTEGEALAVAPVPSSRAIVASGDSGAAKCTITCDEFDEDDLPDVVLRSIDVDVTFAAKVQAQGGT